MFSRLLAAALVVTSLFLSTQSSAQIAHRRLTPAEIESAIDDGIQQEPEPYLLRGRNLGEGASVTTPYLRVRFAANKAWRETRHRLTPEEIPPGLLAPVALITVPFGHPESASSFTHEYVVCESEGEMEFAAFRKGKDWIPSNSSFRDDVPQEFRPMRPAWQTEADLPGMGASVGRLSERYGADGITAAYPLEFMRSDLQFVLMHKNHDGNCHGAFILSLRVMRIHPENLATWR